MRKSLISIVLVLIALLAISLVGCSKNDNNEKEIVGYWKNDTTLPGYEFIYTFNEDGTGNYNSAGTDMPFKYVISGKNISFFYDGVDVPFDTEFEINGNVLNVKDSNNEDVLYNRMSDNEAKALNSEVSTENNDIPKNEQTGTAGSNIPLKDNYEEAEYQIKDAFQYWIVKTYGDSVVDTRINVDKIYTAEEEQEIEALKEKNLGPNEIAFEVSYELKPADDADINALTAATGVYDEESGWIKEKFNLGILRPTINEEALYRVTDVGTGW